MKLRKQGLRDPQALLGLAVARGCSHYVSYVDRPLPENTGEGVSNEELGIALLSPSNPYDPRLIRVGAQILSDRSCNPDRLAALAIRERSAPIVRYIAEHGHATEPDNDTWLRILAILPESRPIKPGVMPHPSRFRTETGIQRSFGSHLDKIRWLRPSPHEQSSQDSSNFGSEPISSG